MTITEILQFADELVFAQTGKHLDDLQETVIKGVWQGQTYEAIADECKRSESRVRDVGYKLWQILSEQLGQEVNKSNFRSTISRLNTRSPQIINVGSNHNFNFCSSCYQPNNQNQKHHLSHQSSDRHDLTLAPKITHFYGRETELKTLSHRLVEQNTRVFSVLGLPGIGKTTLVKQFVDQNLQHFEIVIWKSIKLSPSLDSIINEIITSTNPDPLIADNQLTQIFKLLRQRKCLIVLDDVQEIFTGQQCTGQYKSEHKDYKNLFTKMPEIEHQSSLLLISQEQCPEMISDEDLYPVQCLELEGIDNTGILKNKKLKDESTWSKLIDLYEGNPAYLKEIASLIKTVFLGKVSEFLAEDTLIITEEMKNRFRELFHRLSPLEQQILLQLSKFNQPVSRDDLRENLQLSSSDLINGIQSLRRRYLLKSVEGEKVMFNLSAVFKEYVRNCCQG